MVLLDQLTKQRKMPTSGTTLIDLLRKGVEKAGDASAPSPTSVRARDVVREVPGALQEMATKTFVREPNEEIVNVLMATTNVPRETAEHAAKKLVNVNPMMGVLRTTTVPSAVLERVAARGTPTAMTQTPSKAMIAAEQAFKYNASMQLRYKGFHDLADKIDDMRPTDFNTFDDLVAYVRGLTTDKRAQALLKDWLGSRIGGLSARGIYDFITSGKISL